MSVLIGLGLIAAVLLLAGPTVLARPAAAFTPKIDPLDHKGYTQAMPDSKVKFEMIAIPGGTFLMGSPKDEPGRQDDEGPQHPVRIAPFWMARTEATWEEFEVFSNEMAAENKEENVQRQKKDPDALTGPTKPYVDKTYGHPHDGHPALCMTHHAAMEYCRWLSRRTGKAYRLPTEAEWEYAARAGTTTAWSFGDDPKALADHAWYDDNSAPAKGEGGQTHAVATRKPNPWGLHDMYGNVMEWCVDHYEAAGYAKSSLELPTLGPVVLPTEKRFSHVARGGSWNDEAKATRSAARRGSELEWMKDDPQRPRSLWWLTRFDVVGFRVVRAVAEQDNLKGLKSKVTLDSD